MYSGVDLNKEEEEFANGEKVADNGETFFRKRAMYHFQAHRK